MPPRPPQVNTVAKTTELDRFDKVAVTSRIAKVDKTAQLSTAAVTASATSDQEVRHG